MVWLKPAQRRADDEDDDRGLEEDLAAVLVAELAPQRRRHRRGQQVRRHDPCQVRAAVQVPHDGGQRRRHDGLVQSGEKHAEQQRTEDQPEPALGDLLDRRGRRCDADAHFTHLFHHVLKGSKVLIRKHPRPTAARFPRTPRGGHGHATPRSAARRGRPAGRARPVPADQRRGGGRSARATVRRGDVTASAAARTPATDHRDDCDGTERRRTDEGRHTPCAPASPICSASSTPSCWPAWVASPTPSSPRPSRRPAASGASGPRPWATPRWWPRWPPFGPRRTSPSASTS